MVHVTSETDRKVCIVSQRANRNKLSSCCGYEFEDVIQSLENSNLYAPKLKSFEHWQHRMRRFLCQRTGLFEMMPSGATSRPLADHYDLFACVVQKPVDILSIDALGDWRKKSDMAVCILEEVWPRKIDQYKPLIKSLGRFDLIACSFADSCERLSELTGKPVIHLPYAVDALRFMPKKSDVDRPIDIYYLGRRRPELHEALMEYTRRNELFYNYDTFTSLPIATDHQAHRDHLAYMIRHSKLFLVDYAKKGHSDETDAQVGWGPRHIEGMAAGAVQVGYAPPSADYLENFDWPTAITRLPEDADAAVDKMSSMLSDPAALDEMRAQTFAHVGRRHDWLQRWRTITNFFGLPDTPAMLERQSAIEALTARLAHQTSNKVIEIDTAHRASK